ncbi:uncharacterized protein LOC118437289 [Folsomia candida]|uniref:uncharacterized protein LOC118437289 n=1 Tax=Folsomia candida TaxID=158441 RepID=UPI0016052C1D|nr:uncharacterized protein LOC118437289 [Folsomia candida]
MPIELDYSDKNCENMRLESTSSREESISLNIDSKNVRVSIDNTMSQVFMNPLILDAIFAKLDLPDLKTSRLVCHDWNDVASTLLGKRAYLHVNKLFSYDAPNLGEMSPVNDQLMRRLLISGLFYKEKPDFIVQALTQVTQLTGEIKFFASRKELVPLLLDRIRGLGSTKIQKIDLTSHWQPNTKYTLPVQACQKLPPQPNLKLLRFNILSQFRHDQKTGCHEFQPLIQIWLDAAPNLTTLDVEASLYPDLEGCRNLKVLKFEFVTRYDYFPNFDVTKVTKMLGQVKDSLIELELCQPMGNGPMEKVQPIHGGPVMSKLTRLSIHATNVFRIHDFFDETHFPKLKTFRVDNGFWKSSVLSHLNLWRRHRGVASLSVTMNHWGLEEEEFWKQMIHIFPTVKQFELKMHNIDCIPLKRSMESFKMWDLEGVNVEVNWVKKSYVLIEVLKSVSVMKDSPTFQGYVRRNNESQYS